MTADHEHSVLSGKALASYGASDGDFPQAPDQQAIVDDDSWALRVEAPAGSGKTHTMVEWAAHHARRLDVDSVPGRSVLAVSFTKRAVGEFRARVTGVLRASGTDESLVEVSTFHSFASKVVNEFGFLLGIRPDEHLINEADERLLIEVALDRVEFTHPNSRAFGTSIHDVSRLEEACSEHAIDPTFAAQWQEDRAQRLAVEMATAKTKEMRYCPTPALQRADLLRGAVEYRELKREKGVSDFGDLMANVVRLLEIDEVRDELRRRHPYVIVDEYQDTNVVQRILLQRFVEPDADMKLVVVGDEAQSIYGFRGATVDNFRSFTDHFPGGATRQLAAVYRHGPEVIEVAEAVVSQSSTWRSRPTDPGDRHSDVRVIRFGTADQEGEFVVDEIRALTEGGVPPRGIAVLAPRWRDLRPLQGSLRALGLPVDLPPKGGLFDLPVFSDLVAILRLADDPGHAISAVRLLRLPRYGLSDRDLIPFVRAAEAASGAEQRRFAIDWREDTGVRLIEGLVHGVEDVTPEARARVDRFLGDLRTINRLARSLSLPDFVEAAADLVGLRVALASSPDPEAPTAVAAIESVVQMARDFRSVRGLTDIGHFVEWLEIMYDLEEPVDIAPPDATRDAIRLLSIHSAKGLQFDHVFLMGVNDGALPGGNSVPPETKDSGRPLLPLGLREAGETEAPDFWIRDVWDQYLADNEAESLDESRRLFYVAATRARASLAVTRGVWARGSDGQPLKGPAKSKFFDDIAAAGIDIEEVGEVPDANPLDAVVVTPMARAEPAAFERAITDGPAAVAAASPVGAAQLAPRVALVDAAVDRLLADEAAPPATPEVPIEFSVSDLVSITRDPVQHARQTLGLPQKPTAAQRRGTLVHRWIEERAWALQEGADPDRVPRPWVPRAGEAVPAASGGRVVVDPDAGDRGPVDDPPEPVASTSEADECASAFLSTDYALRTPAVTELPVVLTVGGVFVKGKIDLVYEGEDGSWEVVDIKTGPLPDEHQWMQLEAYALAMTGPGRELERCRLVFLSLAGSGQVAARPAPPANEIRTRVGAAVAALLG